VPRARTQAIRVLIVSASKQIWLTMSHLSARLARDEAHLQELLDRDDCDAARPAAR
jgi:hypothetical protein